MKHQPQLPPRLQQQQKEQQERKRQQQQQQQQQHQVQTQDVSQRSNKRYSSQRQRVAADTTGGQEGEAAQHSLPHGQKATILQAPYPQSQLIFLCYLTLSSLYTHFNTLKEKAFGKHCGQKVILLK